MKSNDYCFDNDVYCKCRMCSDNQINGGSCSHCYACIDGERAMDTCEDSKN